MVQPGRKVTAGTGYRYGFNGQEKSLEIAEGLTTAEFWQYDARVARRWNVDPKPNISISPYDCFAGNPIFNNDPLGDSTPPKLSMKAQYLEDNRAFAKSIPSQMPNAGAIKFGIGVYNSVLQILDGATQAPLDIHKGRLVLKDVVSAPILVPYNAINNIKNDPLNPTTWGENILPLLPYLAGPLTKKGATLNYESFPGGNTYAHSGNTILGNYTYTKAKGLELDLNIPFNLQGKGLGTKIFSDALQVTNADKFTATWIKSSGYANGASINLQRYQAALKNSTAEQAAWKTWSGQQAAANGFKNVSVKPIQGGAGIEATFTK